MVERRDQRERPRKQQPVAEHVAGHVADAHHRQWVCVHVDVDLAEMPAHRLPCTAGRDAHRLVVVAHRATRREGIAQPEPATNRDLVGDVAECRCSLVGRNHEVRVVAVETHDVARCDDLATDAIVSDVEQTLDERAITADHFSLHARSVAHHRLAHDEPTLRAQRHDHGVLHVLRLHQSQDLGAIILTTVGRAQPTARDHAHAKVHPLGIGRVDEDLPPRPRVGKLRDSSRIDLHHDPVERCSVGVHLEVARAHHCTHDRAERAENAVLVETRHLVDLALVLLKQLDCVFLIARGGVESGEERFDERPRKLWMCAQCLAVVLLAEHGAGLAEVLTNAP